MPLLSFWARVEFKIIWKCKYDSYKGKTPLPIYPLPLFLSPGLPCKNASHRRKATLKSLHSPSLAGHHNWNWLERVLFWWITLTSASGTSQAWDGRRCGEGQHSWDFYWIGRLLARPCCLESKQHLSACRGNGAVRALFRTKKRPERIIPTTMDYLLT